MHKHTEEREQNPPEDKYPWLDPDDEQRHLTDKERKF